jgi:hypothetical protein
LDIQDIVKHRFDLQKTNSYTRTKRGLHLTTVCILGSTSS